jgi:CheY-like chemotaxis protein
LEILLVEDSWSVGEAMKDLLELLGADVVGPAATTAEAERLFSEHTPDVALVDFHLRGGELSYSLIARLHERGVPGQPASRSTVVLLKGDVADNSANVADCASPSVRRRALWPDKDQMVCS